MTDRDDEAGDDEAPSRRQVARKARRDAGEDSAKLARELMQLSDSAVSRLGLDEDLQGEVDRARRVTATIARRRAERSLAGALRRVDLEALSAKLANVRATGVGNPARFHLAERWRARLLDEDGAADAFHASFPDDDHPALLRMLDAARRERTTGKPPGAARALFRHVVSVLDAAERNRDIEASETD